MDENNGMITLNIDDIPQIITTQFAELSTFHEQIEQAKARALAAKQSADSVTAHTKGLGAGKTAIGLLQKATSELADSQMVLTEAQQLSFQYQEKLSKVVQFLFGLGTASLASNRAVIKKLELLLTDGDVASLDELTQKEIVGLVQQLKAQEDILQKQADLEQKIKTQAATNETQTIQIQQQLLKDIEHDRLLEENTLNDKAQDKQIEDLHKEIKRLRNGQIVSFIIGGIALVLAIIGIVL